MYVCIYVFYIYTYMRMHIHKYIYIDTCVQNVFDMYHQEKRKKDSRLSGFIHENNKHYTLINVN
jgi:hypothetical protein